MVEGETVVATEVFCKFQLEGFHRWPKASGETYLEALHRHMFHFEVQMSVDDDDRQIEFIAARRWIMGQVARWFTPGRDVTFSCEQLAKRIVFLVHSEFHCKHIIAVVSEDGENGAMADGWFA